MKFDPIDEDDPSPKAMARGINQTHQCVDAHRKEVRPKLTSLARSQTRLRKDQTVIRQELAAIKKAFRIGDDGKGRSVATQRPWVAGVQLAGAIGGGIVTAGAILRFLYAAWPDLTHLAIKFLTTP